MYIPLQCQFQKESQLPQHISHHETHEGRKERPS
jgi:hypothetical protein